MGAGEKLLLGSSNPEIPEGKLSITHDNSHKEQPYFYMRNQLNLNEFVLLVKF